MAWYYANSGKRAHPVAQKQANAFGLYDMSGNAYELVQDTWHKNYNGATTDGSAWEGSGDSDDAKVLRGGSANQGSTRASYRSYDDPANRFYVTGFRLARTLP